MTALVAGQFPAPTPHAEPRQDRWLTYEGGRHPAWPDRPLRLTGGGDLLVELGRFDLMRRCL